MRTRSFKNSTGYALVTVMVFGAVGFALLAAAMSWTSTSVRLTARNNEYRTAVAAAEAATEKVMAQLSLDYRIGGFNSIVANEDTYRSMVPLPSENTFWRDFEFNDAMGHADTTYVCQTLTNTWGIFENPKFAGLSGPHVNYRVISNVRNTNSPYGVIGAAQLELEAASAPIFQFAIYYNMDLEVNPGDDMIVRGRVQCNGNIWCGPSGHLIFTNGGVSATGTIINTRHPLDPDYVNPISGTVTYNTTKTANGPYIDLPIGTNSSSSAAVREILKVPPSTESRDSDMGRQRYFNKAELILLVTNSTVQLIAQNPGTGANSAIPASQATNFMTTNGSFMDQRENKTVKVTEIDVAKLTQWSKTNSTIRSVVGLASGQPINLLYVNDFRYTTGSQMRGVRLINGQTLPGRGFTVATENPLYVKGHYNCTNSSYLGTTNTAATVPASLVSDALTILSGNWNDARSTNSYTQRTAANTTINAAVLTGIVPTTNNPSRYSGGVQNIGRFLEAWSGKTVTLNGSVVTMFASAQATNKFQQPGAYYSVPDRQLNFDYNFMKLGRLPPGTPESRSVARIKWAAPPPNTIDYVASY